jgi:hypothetical protein
MLGKEMKVLVHMFDVFVDHRILRTYHESEPILGGAPRQFIKHDRTMLAFSLPVKLFQDFRIRESDETS